MYKRISHWGAFALGLIVLTYTLMLSLPSLANPYKTVHSAATETSKYYRHIMFRETPLANYRGIYPIETTTAPNMAHYQFDYDASGRVTQIKYQMGQTLIQGNEVWDSFIWFAPKVSISYQQDKEIHSYFDANDRQVAAHGNVYSAHYTLDKEGNRTALHFFDKQNQPSLNAWNIHRYEWRRNEGKLYEKRFNLSNEQQPLRPEFQFYEVELEYDQKGQLAFMRNLGQQGTPTNNDSGAGIDRITYDQNGNFIRWQVYDKTGNPVEGNRPMVHLGEHLYDQNGNKVGLRGFDRYGNRIPFSWGAFEHTNEYNTLGNQVRSWVTPKNGNVGSIFEREYSEDNSKVRLLKSVNPKGQLTTSPMLGGAAQVQYFRQQDGSLSHQLLNADGSPFKQAAANSAGQ